MGIGGAFGQARSHTHRGAERAEVESGPDRPRLEGREVSGGEVGGSMEDSIVVSAWTPPGRASVRRSRAGADATVADDCGKESAMDHPAFKSWLDRYVDAWRLLDPVAIGDLFSADVRYAFSPFDEAVVGRPAVRRGLAGGP